VKYQTENVFTSSAFTFDPPLNVVRLGDAVVHFQLQRGIGQQASCLLNSWSVEPPQSLAIVTQCNLPNYDLMSIPTCARALNNHMLLT